MEQSTPGQTLFRFVRIWSRRWTGAGYAVEQARGRDVMVIEAVIAVGATRPGTVNDIAAELGIDQSGASRMVSQAIAGGYLVAEIGPDRRQRYVRATPEGLRLVEQAHAWQEQVFAGLTADWTADEVAVFTELMGRLVVSRRDD
jgi:DNA-binding MarR family transcriptional regulator